MTPVFFLMIRESKADKYFIAPGPRPVICGPAAKATGLFVNDYMLNGEIGRKSGRVGQ